MPATATDRLNGITTSVAVKPAVRIATTANITLSGLQTIAGAALAEGDRVLVKDQADLTQNGIYEASTSDWQRAPDFDGARDAIHGTLVVASLNNGQGLLWQLTTADPVVFGTSSITFSQFTNPSRVYTVNSDEDSAGLTIADYGYIWWDIRRYVTNTVPGTTDVTSAIQAAYNAMPAGQTLVFDHGPYRLSGANALVFDDDDKHFQFNATEFRHANAGSTDVAVTFGPGAGVQISDISITGRLHVINTATISHNGSQTAASQLKGTAVKLTNCNGLTWNGGCYINGWKYGHYHTGNAGGHTNCVFSGKFVFQDCLIDIYGTNVDVLNSFCTQIEYSSAYNVFNPAFYSDGQVVVGVQQLPVGTRGVEALRNNRTLDGWNFFGGTLEGAKERKAKWDGTYTIFENVYFDLSNSTDPASIDIELTSNARFVEFRAGGGLDLLKFQDNGALNSFPDPKTIQFLRNGGMRHRYNGTAQFGADARFIGQTMANNDQFVLEAKNGFCAVSAGANLGYFSVTSTGGTALISGSSNMSNTTGAGKLALLNNAGIPTVENRLGTTQNVLIDYRYVST